MKLIYSALLTITANHALGNSVDIPPPPSCHADLENCHHFKGEMTETTSFFPHEIVSGPEREYTTRVLSYHSMSSELEIVLFDHQLNKLVNLDSGRDITQGCVPDGKYEWFVQRRDGDESNKEPLVYDVWLVEDHKSHVLCQVGENGEFANINDPGFAEDDLAGDRLGTEENKHHEIEEAPNKEVEVGSTDKIHQVPLLPDHHIKKDPHEENRHETEKPLISSEEEHYYHPVDHNSQTPPLDHVLHGQPPNQDANIVDPHQQPPPGWVNSELEHELHDKTLPPPPHQPHIPADLDTQSSSTKSEGDSITINNSSPTEAYLSYNVISGLVITTFIIVMILLISAVTVLLFRCLRSRNRVRYEKKVTACDSRIDALDEDDDDDNEIVCVAPSRMPSVYHNSKPVPQIPNHYGQMAKPVSGLNRKVRPRQDGDAEDQVVVILHEENGEGDSDSDSDSE
eukprot:Awhi_evm2s1992